MIEIIFDENRTRETSYRDGVARVTYTWERTGRLWSVITKIKRAP